MNALTTVNQGMPSQLQRLVSPLAAVLERVQVERTRIEDFPVISKYEREAIPAAIAELRKSLAGSTPDHVAAVLGAMSFALPKKHGGGDAEAMLSIYAKALADIPPDVLDAAGIEAVKTLKFFPKVAELRELALPEITRRRWNISVLQRLAEKYDKEANAKPVKLIEPAQIADLKARIADRFPTQRTAA